MVFVVCCCNDTCGKGGRYSVNSDLRYSLI